MTQERVDKLLRQVGDKEVEMDALIKTSPKQMWTADLDDFLAEWVLFSSRTRRSRPLSRAKMGRRASNKLKIGVKGGKKRKNDDSDADSDAGLWRRAKG